MKLSQPVDTCIRNAIFEAAAPYREIPHFPLSFPQPLPSLTYLPLGTLTTADDFFRFQHETSSVIDRVKDAAIKQYEVFFTASFSALDNTIFHLHEKRRNTVRHRGVFSRICARALQGKEDSFLPCLGASVEFLLEYMYYINQVLDSKSNPNIPLNFAAASASVALGRALLVSHESKLKQDECSEALLQIYTSTQQGFDYGEFFDCNLNTWPHLKESSLEQRLASCNHRVYYIDTLFYQSIVELVARTLSVTKTPVDTSRCVALSAYAHYFGMGLQIVNDVADFVPPHLQTGTSEKTSDDAYNDIKHSHMTYPTIAMLKLASSSDRDTVISALEQGDHTHPQTLEEITNVFLRSGAYHECRALTRKYQRQAIECAKFFDGDARFLLARTSIILDSNRYYRALSSLYEQMKGGEQT